MPRSFKLPDLGEGIHEAEIQDILVSPGDEVEEDQVIMVVETDKAAVEVPSPFAGVVESIDVEAGDLVSVGTPLLTFSNGGAESQAEEPEAAGETEAEDRDAAKPGGAVAQPEQEGQPQPQAAQERSHGPVSASPATRRLARELDVDLSQVPPSGPEGLVTAQDVRSFAETGAPARPEEEEEKAGPRPQPESQREERAPQEGPSVRPSLIRSPALPDLERFGPVERVPLRSVRRATARQMALAWSQIPHVSHHEVVDITELEALRQQHKQEIEAQGGRLTLTVFALKAAVAALKDHPRFNASLDADAGEIVLRHYYHLGLAVDTDRGLLVPVIRDVDRKSITELSVEIVELVERTQAGDATLQDLQGSTFTITNIGVIGGTSFSPIINYPNVAILGMARAQMRPTAMSYQTLQEARLAGDRPAVSVSAGVEIAELVTTESPEGNRDELVVVPRLMLPLVLAFDHRVADGADAAYFMRDLAAMLEQPDRLALSI